MLFSLFLVTFRNRLLYFVCIRYLVVLQWLRPWATLLLNLIVLHLIVLFTGHHFDSHIWQASFRTSGLLWHKQRKLLLLCIYYAITYMLVCYNLVHVKKTVQAKRNCYQAPKMKKSRGTINSPPCMTATWHEEQIPFSNFLG